MGVRVDSQNSCPWSFVTRRKKVDSAGTTSNDSENQLAKELTVPHLMAIGISISISLSVSFFLQFLICTVVRILIY